jgi:hypothetical protein
VLETALEAASEMQAAWKQAAEGKAPLRPRFEK